MLANTLKTTAIAVLLGLGAAGASGTAVSAYTMKTRCDGDDCARLQCNDYGYDCVRTGYTDRYDYDRPYSYTAHTYRYDYDQPYSYTTPGYSYYPDYNRGYYPDYDQDYDAGPYPPPTDYDYDYDYPG